VQLLLLVLPVNIAQPRRQLFQQRRRHRPAGRERPRLPVGQNLPLDQQFVLLQRGLDLARRELGLVLLSLGAARMEILKQIRVLRKSCRSN
jgi:hypothetical protein